MPQPGESALVSPQGACTANPYCKKILMTDLPIGPIYCCTNPVFVSKHLKDFYQLTLRIADWKNTDMG